jgi:hypothetical protein
MTDRDAGRERDRLIRSPERGQSRRDFAERALLAVVKEPLDRVTRCRHTQRSKRAVAHDRLRVDALARSVDPAVSEDRTGDGKTIISPRARNVEPPGRKVWVGPVDGGDGAVVAERDADVSLEAVVPAAFFVVRRLWHGPPRKAGKSTCIGDGGGEAAAARVVQHDRGALLRDAIADASHPDGGVARANACVDAEVGHLHEGSRPLTAYVAAAAAAGDLDREQRRRPRAPGIESRQGKTADHRTIDATADGDTLDARRNV